MKILHVASEYPPQQVFGLGRYVCDLSRELARQGHAVHVLTNSIGGPGQDVQEGGVPIHRIDFPPPPKPRAAGAPVMAFNLHLQQRAYALGAERLGNPQVVVTHDWLTALAGHRISRRWGIPHVWTVHDTVWGKRKGVIDNEEDRLTFEIERWAVGESDLILVNSRAIRDEIEGPYRGRGSRIEILPCALDPEDFTCLYPDSRLRAFRGVFAQEDELLVTYCGRLDLEKGIDVLVNAFAKLVSRRPKARLAIAGRGVLQELIEKHVQRLHLGHAVRLVGYLEGVALRHFYQVSDIHVCPSHYEPFGLVAIEAMASGTAVAVSRTGGLLEVVTSPEVGRTFPPGDAEALAQVLEELASDERLRERLGQAGRDHVRRDFSWSHRAVEAAGFYSTAPPGKN